MKVVEVYRPGPRQTWWSFGLKNRVQSLGRRLMNRGGAAVRLRVPWERLAIGALCGAICVATTVVDAQITVENSGATAGLLATNSPDVQCIGIGQAWMTGGVGVGDFNNDGWPDLFVIGGGLAADKLFINSGLGTFTNEATAWGI